MLTEGVLIPIVSIRYTVNVWVSTDVLLITSNKIEPNFTYCLLKIQFSIGKEVNKLNSEVVAVKMRAFSMSFMLI